MQADKIHRPINPLLECGETIFSLMAVFIKGDRGAGLGPDYRDKILSGFDIMERMAFERQIGSLVLKDAKYALAAYIDEAVLSSAWPGRSQWMSRPLQLELFGDHLAGEGFYDRLNQLRQGGETNLDLLELYYVCLQLGFEGVYKIRGLEQLMALQVDLRSQIEGYRGVLDPKLSPEGIPAVPLISRVGREVPYWVITVVTISVIFFTHLGYSMALTKLADRSVASIESRKDAIVLPAGIAEPSPAAQTQTATSAQKSGPTQ
jgi:type VI secretion system protein ImpK